VRSPFEVSELQVHCKLHCFAEQQIELQSRQLQSLTQFRVDGQTMEPNLSDLCQQATKALFLQLHTVVKQFFNDMTIFKTKHRYRLQPQDDINVH